VVHELADRYRQLVDGAEDVTIVFDKGNNTEDTVEVVMDKYGSPKAAVGLAG
jgi:transposase